LKVETHARVTRPVQRADFFPSASLLVSVKKRPVSLNRMNQCLPKRNTTHLVQRDTFYQYGTNFGRDLYIFI